MSNYLKLNSVRPEFFHSMKDKDKTGTPEGYTEFTDQEISELQLAMDTDPDGSVVNGKWIKSQE